MDPIADCREILESLAWECLDPIRPCLSRAWMDCLYISVFSPNGCLCECHAENKPKK